jgi:hypothetical protein
MGFQKRRVLFGISDNVQNPETQKLNSNLYLFVFIGAQADCQVLELFFILLTILYYHLWKQTHSSKNHQRVKLMPLISQDVIQTFLIFIL